MLTYGEAVRRMSFVEFIQGLWQNRIMLSAMAGWAVAQFVKAVIDGLLTRDWKIERLWGSGGMPSSHAATVSALVVATAYNYGPASFEFTIAFWLAVIVLHDARGVRLETGRQAEILNAVTRFLRQEEGSIELPEQELKELIGHTPIQVIAGTVIGVAVGVLLH